MLMQRSNIIKHAVMAGSRLIVMAGLTGNLLLLLASCSKNTPAPFVPVPDESAPIEFSETVLPETKGLDPVDNAPEGILWQHFGVFSWWNPRGTVFDAVSNPANFYQHNNHVAPIDPEETVGGFRKWHCTPSAYWPLGCNLSFFAYAPYLMHTQPYEESGEQKTPQLIFPSDDYVQGMPRATYTPDVRVTNQVDLCIAAPVFDRVPSPEPIHFAFKHVMTRIRLFVRLLGDTPDANHFYRIDDAIISGVLGTNSFTYNDTPDVPVIWDSVDASEPREGEYHLTVNDQQLISGAMGISDSYSDNDISTYTCVNNEDNGRLYLLPQELTTAAELELAIGFYYQNGGQTRRVSILPPFTVSLPASQAWVSSSTVAYLVTVDVSKFVVMDINPLVTPWEDAGNTHPDQIIY